MMLSDLLKNLNQNEIVELSYLGSGFYTFMGEVNSIPSIYYNDEVVKLETAFGLTEDIIFLRIKLNAK